MNFENTTLCAYKSRSPILEIELYSYGVISTTIIFFGIAGNILNITVFNRSKRKASVLICVIAKALVDLVSVLLALVWASKYWIYDRSLTHHPWAYFKCYVELSIWNAFVGAGMLLMVIITIERYLSLVYPLKFHVLRHKKRGYVASILITAFSLVYFIPHCFRKTLVQFKDKDDLTWYICCDDSKYVTSREYHLYVWSQQILFRFIPVVLIFLFNIAMVVQFKKIQRQRRNMTTNRQHQHFDRRKEPLTRMLMGFSVMFLFCATPSAVLIAINSDDKQHLLGFQIFRAFSNVLEIAGYSSSFYIYIISSKEFRRKLFHAAKKKSAIIEPTIHLLDANRSQSRIRARTSLGADVLSINQSS